LPANVDAVLGRASRELRRVGARHQGFGRNAAGIDAGAAEVFALDDGDFHACVRQTRRQRRSGLPCADDNGVKACGHGLSPFNAKP